MTSVAPDLNLALYIFQCREPRLKNLHDSAEKSLHEAIVKGNLTPLYKHLVPSGSSTYDADLVKRMEEANKVEEEKLREQIKEAEESEDDSSVLDAWTKLGMWYCQICDLPNAEETLRKTSDKTASVGPKIDICLALVRMGFLYNDLKLIAKELETARVLIERGGDWERKNKFKTYNGLYFMSIRKFEEAADLLLDSFATFTCTELLSYEEVVAYGAICGALSLDRVSLKKRVVDSPEFLSLVPTTKLLEPLSVMVNSLYTCAYESFLVALAEVEEQILRTSPFLSVHSAYYVREMRCKAYSQLLESYMSLNIQSMAESFGVSVEYLESDLSHLIPHRKVNCILDKVNGVIVTNRPDTKNAQYRQFIERGDELLTKLQKFGASVRLYGADNL
ncbi:proteasome regulatory particle lid subunit [Starmerella bacillaris]|uniref:Proteasome regulatory particle lid subunit n=1 Tax=Starmerella bacillaris TaxID=1247836 RepID=A0AAV5REF6_STABA|nr:proteasome regulatory particle lid subunit [Starmerella bacillaris]